MKLKTRRNRPMEVTDAPERRSIPMDRIELRSVEGGDPNELILKGYASTFEPYEMYGGPEKGGWIEQLDRGAFDLTLREKPDLHLLINHAGMPLARTKSGTMDLSVDDGGLFVEARLDRRDPEVQALEIKMDRGDMDEMSFAFRVKKQEWRAAPGCEDDEESMRSITEVSLHKGDVSVVNFGANPTTHAELSRSVPDALEFLANALEEDLVELRSQTDIDNLKRVQERLTALRSAAALDEEEVKAEEPMAVLSIGAEGIDNPFMHFALHPDRRDENGNYVHELSAEMISALRALLEEVESKNSDESAEEAEELGDGVEEEASEVTDGAEALSEAADTMTYREAMALQGIDIEGDEPLSLREALALAEIA